MKNIKLCFWGLLIVLTGLWLAADPVFSSPLSFSVWRLALINYSGIIAMGVMSVALLLALRPVLFAPVLGSIDKMYRLHRWLGLTGLVMIILHWLLTQVTGWLMHWFSSGRTGLIDTSELTVTIISALQSQRGLAQALGGWAFYAAVALIVLALVKQFPYRYFFKTHRLLAVVYLLLVFHALVLMKLNYWASSIAGLMVLLMTAGSVAALIILVRKQGHSRQVVGVIEEVIPHKDNHVLEVAIQIKGRWSGHEVGQFAFVTMGDKERAHPFSISSVWNEDAHSLFLHMELGDYTRSLPFRLKVGDVVKVEGPYGQFDFSGDKPRQIWVGSGIGMTPFIARMKKLAQQPDGKSIDLFYTTNKRDEEAIKRLRQSAAEANVRLYVLVESYDGRLDAGRIAQAVPEWKQGDVWFCGPAGFARDLRRGFIAKGLAPDDFHQELFTVR